MRVRISTICAAGSGGGCSTAARRPSRCRDRRACRSPSRCSTRSASPSRAASSRARGIAAGRSITVDRIGGCRRQIEAPSRPCEPARSSSRVAPRCTGTRLASTGASKPRRLEHRLLVVPPRDRIGQRVMKVEPFTGAHQRLEMPGELPLRVVPLHEPREIARGAVDHRPLAERRQREAIAVELEIAAEDEAAQQHVETVGVELERGGQARRRVRLERQPLEDAEAARRP